MGKSSRSVKRAVIIAAVASLMSMGAIELAPVSSNAAGSSAAKATAARAPATPRVTALGSWPAGSKGAKRARAAALRQEQARGAHAQGRPPAAACGAGYCTSGSALTTQQTLFYVNPNTADVTGEEGAVAAAMQTWVNDAGSNFAAAYAGTTSSTTIADDGVNVVFWTSNPPACGSAGTAYLACTFGYANGFDTVLNDTYTWSIGAASGKYDIQSVAVHELGHALGLGHYTNDTEVMNPAIGANLTKRALFSGDIAGIRAIYEPPIGSLDGAGLVPGALRVGGWALDNDTPTTSIRADVYVDGHGLAPLSASSSRPDVGNAYPAAGNNHGFDATLTTSLSTGDHSVCVYGIDSYGGENPVIGCKTVTNRAPYGSLDSVSVVAGGLHVRGWAIDPDTTTSTAAHVYVDGVGAAALTANTNRPDVGSAYPGYGDNHGFDSDVSVALSAGDHQVCVYAIDTNGGSNPTLACKTVTNRTPVGSFDGVAAVTVPLGGVRITGWAIDPDQTSPSTVHVYVDGSFLMALTAGTDRPDVGSAYPGYGNAHGFDSTIKVASGTHQICVYAIDSSGGSNPQLGCKTISH